MAIKVRNIEVGNLIGESSRFRVYLGHLPEDQKVIAKVAKTINDNIILTEDARAFNRLKDFELHLREVAKYPCADAVNYHLLFARLTSSFIEESQKDRRINVFTTPEIDLDDVTPLSQLSSQVEIDSRTSVWIIGRFFKFYSMFEIMRIAENDDACRYPVFSEHDYLVGPKNHRLIYYNYSGEIYDIIATDLVKAISKYMLSWIVFDNTDKDIKYHQLLDDLATNGRTTAAEAHSDLYDLIRELWGIQYHPFTYRQRETMTWKSIEEE